MKARIPNHPTWVFILRYAAMSGWGIIFAIGFGTSSGRQSPFMEHGLTMMLVGLCVAGVGVSAFFARFGPDEVPEVGAVLLSKVVGAWFMGFGLLLEGMGLSRLLY